MPITTAVPIKVFDQDQFHPIDTRVTGFAFDIHNEFGRYLEEGLYQNELVSIRFSTATRSLISLAARNMCYVEFRCGREARPSVRRKCTC